MTKFLVSHVLLDVMVVIQRLVYAQNVLTLISNQLDKLFDLMRLEGVVVIIVVHPTALTVDGLIGMLNQVLNVVGVSQGSMLMSH